MPNKVTLAQNDFERGFYSTTILGGGTEQFYAVGSRNILISGPLVRPWRGLESQGPDTGVRKAVQFGQDWGGLKDTDTAQGAGSLFKDIANSAWFIGAGRPSVSGVDLGVGILASTLLKVSISEAGIYSAATTYDAGLPQPSAPDVGIINTPGPGFTGFINGPVSVKIARLRLTTGARSIGSLTSAVVSPVNKTVRVTFPLASTGQDNWAVFFTQQGFGGVGLHYRTAYLDSLDIPESVVAAGTIDGIPRSLEFDFKDGDLIPEVAWIDDYPPPAGTQAVRVENVMCVLGCYADATDEPTPTASGTVGAISLPNFYESYKPRYLVYFPEPVVDVLSRPTDSYAYVAHRNAITSLQYVGILDGPAVAVNVVWPDIGIAIPHNWCQVHGLIYAYVARGGMVRMLSDGSPDFSFANPVREFTKDWNIEDTIVGWHPNTMCVVWFNNRVALSWSLQAERWSPPIYLEDAGSPGIAFVGQTEGGCPPPVGDIFLTESGGFMMTQDGSFLALE